MNTSSDEVVNRSGSQDVYRWSRRVLDTLSNEERQVCFWKKVEFSSQDIADYWGWPSASVDAVFAQAQDRIASARVAGAVATSRMPAGVRSAK